MEDVRSGHILDIASFLNDGLLFREYAYEGKRHGHGQRFDLTELQEWAWHSLSKKGKVEAGAS